MPGWLLVFTPADWSDDPGDLVGWFYFGRCRWLDARAEWQAGGSPRPVIHSPRPVAGPGAYTSPMSGRSGGGAPSRP